MYLPVEYVALPKGRSFMMSGEHASVSNAMVDSKTPQVCLVTNPTGTTLQIKKHARLATIHECDEDVAYFVSSHGNAFNALTVATALGTAYTPTTDTRRTVPSGNPSGAKALVSTEFADTPIASVNGEFTLDTLMRAVCNGQIQSSEPAAALTHASDTPFPVAVCEDDEARKVEDTPVLDDPWDPGIWPGSQAHTTARKHNEVVVTASKAGHLFCFPALQLSNWIFATASSPRNHGWKWM